MTDSLETCAQTRLASLNSIEAQELGNTLKQVCHSTTWVENMLDLAPFTSAQDLLDKGAQAWSRCEEPDWKEALQGHPRIGQKAKGSSLSAAWSKGEQAGAATPDEQVRATLLDAQEEYFQKFGFIFLICATGKSSEQILKAAQARLNNTVQDELKTVAEEQGKIIQLRLEKLLNS